MSALPDNALTVLERKANAKRRALYDVLLWAAVIISVAVSFVVFGALAFEEGLRTGRDLEKRIAANTARPAPANCKEWLRQCAAQEVDSWTRRHK